MRLSKERRTKVYSLFKSEAIFDFYWMIKSYSILFKFCLCRYSRQNFDENIDIGFLTNAVRVIYVLEISQSLASSRFLAKYSFLFIRLIIKRCKPFTPDMAV